MVPELSDVGGPTVLDKGIEDSANLATLGEICNTCQNFSSLTVTFPSVNTSRSESMLLTVNSTGLL